MSLIKITDIWRGLRLPHNDLSDEILDALRVARKPGTTVHDCPDHHHGTDRHSRACRVAWRVAFRLARETGEVAFITLSGSER
jgi:hypothetical protein